jgi:hypothetical protein
MDHRVGATTVYFSKGTSKTKMKFESKQMATNRTAAPRTTLTRAASKNLLGERGSASGLTGLRLVVSPGDGGGSLQEDNDMENLSDLRQIKTLIHKISDPELLDAIWRLADSIQQRIDPPVAVGVAA